MQDLELEVPRVGVYHAHGHPDVAGGYHHGSRGGREANVFAMTRRIALVCSADGRNPGMTLPTNNGFLGGAGFHVGSF